MMPRIQAQEMLNGVRTGALSFGSYEKNDAQALLRELRERASGEVVRVRKASPAVLAMMGIGTRPAVQQAKAENDG